MNPKFADWYRKAVPVVTEDELKKRWAGIEKFSKKPARKDWFDAVRCYCDIPTKDDNFKTRFAQAFKEADVAFPMEKNQFELRVLAGSMLFHRLDTYSDESDAIALSLLCASFGRHALSFPLDGSLERANDYLLTEGQRVRRSAKSRKIDVAKLKEDDSLTQAKQSLGASADYTLKLVQSLATQFNEVAEGIQQVHQEESDILWWIFSGHSNDLNVRMAEIPVPGLALICGAELAELTQFVPGPPGSSAFLDKALSYRERLAETTLIEAVNATKTEWRTKLTKKVQSELGNYEDLCPVLTAVKKSLEVEDAEGWVSPFKFSMKLDPKLKVAPLLVANQIYREFLLLRPVG